MTRKIESQRFLFTSSRISTEKPLGQQMDHSANANAMASSFKKAKVFGNRTERVPCSRIRMSVITEPVSLGAEHLSSIDNCFAKHSEKVCKKYYVRHFSERERERERSSQAIVGVLSEVHAKPRCSKSLQNEISCY